MILPGPLHVSCLLCRFISRGTSAKPGVPQLFLTSTTCVAGCGVSKPRPRSWRFSVGHSGHSPAQGQACLSIPVSAYIYCCSFDLASSHPRTLAGLEKLIGTDFVVSLKHTTNDRKSNMAAARRLGTSSLSISKNQGD